MDTDTTNGMEFYRLDGDVLHILSATDGMENGEIPIGMFAGRNDFRYVRIHGGIETIGEGAFRDCGELRDIVIPEGVKTIGRSAFEGCTKLGYTELPAGIETLGDRAFAGCSAMTLSPLHGSLSHIGNGVFAGCQGIKEFRFNGSGRYTTRMKMLFDGSEDALVMYPCGLDAEDVTVPDSTKSIRDGAFDGFRGENINIGSEVSSVTAKAFACCPNLERFDVDYDSEFFFDDCSSLFGDDGQRLVRVPPKLTVLNLEDITRIDEGAFEGCDTLREIKISGCSPDADLGELSKIPNLKSLKVGADNICRLPFRFLDPDGTEIENPAGGDYRMEPGKGFILVTKKELVKEEGNNCVKHQSEDSDDGDSKFRPVRITGTTFDDIAGLQRAKDEIYEHFILPNLHKELFKEFDIEPSTGLLLYGPPGTGKTMLARAVACELEASFYSVRPSDILSRWVGDEEENIRELFRAARKNERSVIFFDDFEALGRKRGNEREPWGDDLLAELLTQIQGLEKHEGTLLIIAATNRPWTLDSALMRSGRFSTKVLVQLPDRESREWIFRNRLSKSPCSESLDFGSMAEATEGYNGADIEEICTKAKILRVKAIADGDNMHAITPDDIGRAIRSIPSSVVPRDVLDTERYSKTGYGPNDASEGEYLPSKNKIGIKGYV